MMEKSRGDSVLCHSKTVTLPRLNRLSPSLESTALKIMEESGELAQAIGKFRGLNGELLRIEEAEAMHMVAQELIDVAQTAVTMMFVLEEQYGIDIEKILEEHVKKLKQKGYCD
ncbi:MazG nucleotide pyrophosphohydrolase family protein [Desulfitobacterium dichloroeliminans LMG P-21439]|uniref:MazG nucleotide pyrophosphohydrolase family protein n=2 Tax=Desulfitobacterium dichloroeliminans TaxID=233055 RepID=L0FC82_DESDL|nr:MazG nucleotide pyrophosphohydrolase family protein [Desulfitobacterium dichloroeliminans LMG P-21439]